MKIWKETPGKHIGHSSYSWKHIGHSSYSWSPAPVTLLKRAVILVLMRICEIGQTKVAKVVKRKIFSQKLQTVLHSSHGYLPPLFPYLKHPKMLNHFKQVDKPFLRHL